MCCNSNTKSPSFEFNTGGVRLIYVYSYLATSPYLGDAPKTSRDTHGFRYSDPRSDYLGVLGPRWAASTNSPWAAPVALLAVNQPTLL